MTVKKKWRLFGNDLNEPEECTITLEEFHRLRCYDVVTHDIIVKQVGKKGDAYEGRDGPGGY